MRDIKFRAWDKFFEEMYYFDFKNNIDVRNGILWINHKEGAISCQSPSVKLMQYTGLKDRGGTEIYDGDILEYDGFWGIRVEYEDGVFWVRDFDDVRYNNRIINIPIAEFALHNWQVKGNIYENPELLEV